MKYIEAPEFSIEIQRLPKSQNLFLAGSITGVENDWRKEILAVETAEDRFFPRQTSLSKIYNIFNPLRKNFDVTDPLMEQEQIIWEHHCIHQCDHILFWFAAETLAPITLFEYGKALKTHRHENIHVGIHPEYKRMNDVIIQTQLESDEIAQRIVYSVTSLALKVIYGHRRNPALLPKR